MHQVKSVAGVYGMIHFLVDFCCAFFMFSASGRIEEFYIGFLLYNFLAFALQMPVGLIADRIKRNPYVAALGCLLVLGALLCLWICPGGQDALWAGLGLAGTGNCLFHVGGGIEVMKRSKNEAAPLGIFVSPGAIGIFFGTMLGREGNLSPVFLTGLLAGAVIWLFYISRGQGAALAEGLCRDAQMTDAGFVQPYTVAVGAVLCFFLVVVFRSYLGMIAVFPWKDTLTEGILVLAAVFGGKLAGGFAADKLGIRKAAVGTLGAATVLFLGSDVMWAGVLALFFFNMSMPITLYLAAKVLKGQNGFAFGILTFGIFIGFLPAYAGGNACSRWILTVLSALSLIFLGAGVCLYKRLTRQADREGIVSAGKEEVV